MKMKMNKILIFTLIVQLFFIGSAQAKCDLESLKFGLSHKALMSKLKLGEEFLGPEINEIPEYFVSISGQELCKNEEVFERASVHFTFIYDKLLEIQIRSFSESASLVDWAVSIYGEKENKPTSFYDVKPNAQWLWDKPNKVIAYSIKPDIGGVFESIIIQSRNHDDDFLKLADELEGK